MRVLTGFAAVFLLTLPLAAQPPDGEFEAQVDVIERIVLVDIPPGFSRQPGDLRVVEDSIEREVVAVDAIDPGSWRVLVYFDAVRTPPEMTFRGALELARQAEELAGLGTVAVVAARQDTVESLGEAGEEQPLLDLLARVAGEAAEDPEIEAQRSPERDRALDQRILDAAGDCAVPPCLLLLVSDGYSSESAASGLDGAEIGKRLSVAGWTVMAVPLVEHDPDQPVLPDRTGQRTEPYYLDLPPVFRVWPWRERKKRGAGQPLSTLDTLTEPRWEPLRQWADATGGWIVRHEAEIPDLLGRLSDRYLVVYRTPVPEVGAADEREPVSLEVRSETRSQTLESPTWVEPARASDLDPS